MNPSVIGLAVAGWLATTWLAYRWGLRSQNEAEKLKAKNNALSIIDNVNSGTENLAGMLGLFQRTKESMGNAIFGVSCQLSETRRVKIEEAWNKYGELYFTGNWSPVVSAQEQDWESFKKDQKTCEKHLKSCARKFAKHKSAP